MVDVGGVTGNSDGCTVAVAEGDDDDSDDDKDDPADEDNDDEDKEKVGLNDDTGKVGRNEPWESSVACIRKGVLGPLQFQARPLIQQPLTVGVFLVADGVVVQETTGFGTIIATRKNETSNASSICDTESNRRRHRISEDLGVGLVVILLCECGW